MNTTPARFERAMWAGATRTDPAWMDEHLAPEFVEFGRSGERYGRDDILALSTGDLDRVELVDLDVRRLADDVALVTNRTVRDREHGHRSSVWRRHDDRWLLEFHQSTPTTG